MESPFSICSWNLYKPVNPNSKRGLSLGILWRTRILMQCSWGLKELLGKCLNLVVDNFLGKHKVPNYRTHVDTIPETFRNMGCNMSLKLQLLHSELNFFSKQPLTDQWQAWWEISQRYLYTEKRYKGKWSPCMFADYCWQLKRETPDKYKRKAVVEQFS